MAHESSSVLVSSCAAGIEWPSRGKGTASAPASSVQLMKTQALSLSLKHASSAIAFGDSLCGKRDVKLTDTPFRSQRSNILLCIHRSTSAAYVEAAKHLESTTKTNRLLDNSDYLAARQATGSRWSLFRRLLETFNTANATAISWFLAGGADPSSGL